VPFADIRPYTLADRAAAIAALGNVGVLNTPQNRVVVALAGPADGIAVWCAPDAGDVAHLGAVLVPTGARRLMYRLVALCARQAVAAGFRRATFEIREPALLALLQATFTIDAQPLGRDPLTGEPRSWSVEVDLVDALAQLGAVT
jgi:hypothetical protein